MAFGSGSHLHLIDGSAYIFRAYHALPPLTRKSDGMPVGAVSGFCNMLFKFVEDATGPDAPTHVAVIFDAKGKTFRSDIYPEYKANRPPAPEDLVPQFAIIRDATRAFGLPSIELEGFEADDIIATLARQGREAGGRVTILSSDKDLMQLVGGGVEMLDPMKNRRIDVDGVFDKFGVDPARVVDVQALAGDSVDNVPGAPGIGIKTAAQLIQEYGDLDTLLARAEKIKQPKRRETLINFADQIRISRDLVRLDEHVKLDCTNDDFDLNAPDPDKVLTFLQEMEFRTLTTRIAGRLGVAAPEIPVIEGQMASRTTPSVAFDLEAYETVTTIDRLNNWIDRIYTRGHVAFDTETTGLDEMRVDLVGISLATEIGEACYIPLGHMIGEDNELFGGLELAPDQIRMEDAIALLKPVLEDPSILKIGQNMKYDLKIMARNGIHMAPIADTMLMSFASNSGRHNHGMEELSKRYLDHEPISIKSLLGSGKSQITFDRLAVKDAAPYAAEDADITLRLYHALEPMMMREGVSNVYERMERPLVKVLADMEMAGVRVDRDHLAQMSNKFAQELAQLEDEIQEKAGMKFNVNSPKQLGEVLFDHLALEGGKRGKNGAYSTGVDIMEDLASEGHEIPSLILDYRGKSKLKSTYTDALQTHIHPDTGRVHTSYVISGANTGRLSSTSPNVQNIPIRTEEGRRIREAFVASQGHTLVALDYSQIELRLLAEIANLDALRIAFEDGLDIHAMTASEMFNVPIEGMDPAVRRQAKAINFGVIYGISAFGLARNLRIPRADAKDFIDRYFERFPGIRAYMDETVAGAKADGYVSTLFGRKIHTPSINEKGPAAGFAWRAAINAPIQGSAADIIRRAMIRVPDAMKQARLSGKMLLQVHDELVFEVPHDERDATIETVREVMVNAAMPHTKLRVPLEVDAGYGPNWAVAH